ncbi:MAG: hypothetical protein L6R40_002240 [Gallowayella cf. fulva]|nr:MAG: hypothetical protein L6R40_002240 [Xanthomendoza cf. fulva]
MSTPRQQSPPVEPERDTATEDGSSDEEPQVELLVTGRAKRATAGTRMSSLLEREGDDELELLFAEDEQEEDNEFEADDLEDNSDVQLDSASSDDEEGPAKDMDDLEGEKELQRQTRVEKQKKRKAQDVFMKPAAMKKRVKVGPRPGAPRPTSVPTTPAPRPKKKSERVSWLPASEEGPVRASSRKQTVKNKEITNIRLVASEKRRRQQLQVMEEATKRKEASKPKAMTQAQRMEEAARVERSNAKSLNRWESAEKKRLAEQKAKLEALHNRQLTGPVISWWSGMARWVNGKLKQVGWKSIKEAESKGIHQTVRPHDHLKRQSDPESLERPIEEDTIVPREPILQSQPLPSEMAGPVDDGNMASIPPAMLAPAPESQGFLDGIHYYASLPAQTSGNSAYEHSNISTHGQGTLSSILGNYPNTAASGVSLPTAPAIEYSGRNVIILEDIDANAQRLPELQNHVLLKKRNGKPPSK